jgi:hypothetical protein
MPSVQLKLGCNQLPQVGCSPAEGQKDILIIKALAQSKHVKGGNRGEQRYMGVFQLTTLQLSLVPWKDLCNETTTAFIHEIHLY